MDHNYSPHLNNYTNIKFRNELLLFGYCRNTMDIHIPINIIHLFMEYAGPATGGEIYALQHYINMDFIETSAKEGINVEKAFYAVAIRAYNQRKQHLPDSRSVSEEEDCD